MNEQTITTPEITTTFATPDAATLAITIKGRLDAYTTGPIWSAWNKLRKKSAPQRVVLNMAELTYCDVSGITFVKHVEEELRRRQGEFSIESFPEKLKHLLDFYPPHFSVADGLTRRPDPSLPEQVGRSVVGVWRDVRNQIVFLGELLAIFFSVLRHPRQGRIHEILRTMESAGVNAFPIVAMLGLIMGLILAFQAAIQMQKFGADVYVPNMVALSLFRELGPILTAIILAGRSGSAFAAELGTMKINEELNALITMGINPNRYLTLPKVIATTIITPILTIFTNLFGIIGAGLVVVYLGYTPTFYINRVIGAVHMLDLNGGLFKAMIFGILIAFVGCLRGIQTENHARGIGNATTQAVVSGIVLIVLADGFLAVIYYLLGI